MIQLKKKNYTTNKHISRMFLNKSQKGKNLAKLDKQYK